MEFPACNNDNIDHYLMMQTNLHLVEPNVEKLPEQCQEEYVPEPTPPEKFSSHIVLSCCESWNKNNAMLVDEIQNVPDQSEMKEILHYPHYINMF